MIMCVTTINVRQLFIVPEFLFRLWSKLYKTASLKCYQILGSSQYMYTESLILIYCGSSILFYINFCGFVNFIPLFGQRKTLLILWNSTTMKFNKIGVQRKMVKP